MSSTVNDLKDKKGANPFLDASGEKHIAPDLWEPYIIRKEQIDAEIERLSSSPRPDNGRRRSYIVHPLSESPGRGLAAGITVSLDVLLPGENTAPI
ncbi:MAG: gentisate 1,2-dioxygenase, partial [Gammaproteobacteria bacterium]|nr:gentisate 1,2-dioxygenase [Gammaproteobacteria bacterium]